MDSLGTAWPKLVSKKKERKIKTSTSYPQNPDSTTHLFYSHEAEQEYSNCIYQISENQWLIIPDKSIY